MSASDPSAEAGVRKLTGWEVYVLKEQEKKDKLEAAKDRPPLKEAEVIEPGHEIPLAHLSKRTRIGRLGHFADIRGWDVKAGESAYRTAQRYLNGEIVDGRIEKLQWVQGVRGEHHFTASANIILLDGWPADSPEEAMIHVEEYGE